MFSLLTGIHYLGRLSGGWCLLMTGRARRAGGLLIVAGLLLLVAPDFCVAIAGVDGIPVETSGFADEGGFESRAEASANPMSIAMESGAEVYATSVASPTESRGQTSNLTGSLPRSIPDEIIPGFRADQTIERFRFRNDYGGIQTERRSLFQRLWDWLSRFRIRIPSGSGLEFLMYVIAGVLVSVLLFYGIYRAGFQTWFRQNTVSAGYRDAGNRTAPGTTNPDEWLTRGDYRMAVRVMLIGALQHLSARGLISQHINKTNRDYLIELGDHPEREAFAQLSRIYAWVWYGEFEPDDAQMRSAQMAWQTLTRGAKKPGEVV